MPTVRASVANVAIGQRRAATMSAAYRSGSLDAISGDATGLLAHRPGAPWVPGDGSMTKTRALIQLDSTASVDSVALMDRAGLHTKVRVTAGRRDMAERPAVSGDISSATNITPASTYTAGFLLRSVDIRNPSGSPALAYLGTSVAETGRDFIIVRQPGQTQISVIVSRFVSNTTIGNFAEDPSRGIWVWIRITGTTAELIVDDTAQGPVTVSTLSASTSALRLGKAASANVERVDWGAAYLVNEALTGDEIADLSRNPLPANLPASWQLAWLPDSSDVGTSAIVDRSQQSRDATIVSPAWTEMRNPTATEVIRDRWEAWQKRPALRMPGGTGPVGVSGSVFPVPPSWTAEFSIRVDRRFLYTAATAVRLLTVGIGGGVGDTFEAAVILQTDGILRFNSRRKLVANSVSMDSTTNLADGELHRVRVSITDTGTSTGRVEIDGVEEAQATVAAHLYAATTSFEIGGAAGGASGLLEISDLVVWRRAGPAAPEHRGVAGRWGGAAEDPSIYAQWPCLEGTGNTGRNIGSVSSGDFTLTGHEWVTWSTPTASEHLVDPPADRPHGMVLDFGETVETDDLLVEIMDPEADATYTLRYLDAYQMLRPDLGAASITPSTTASAPIGPSGWPAVPVGAPSRSWTAQLDGLTRSEGMHLLQLLRQRGRIVPLSGFGADDDFVDAYRPHRSLLGVTTGEARLERSLDSFLEFTLTFQLSEATL